MTNGALFRLGFPSASYLLVLNLATFNNSPDRSTKSTRSHFIIVLPLLVNIEFQVLFHSAPAVLFTFPSQYYALSVTEEYLGLGGGPPGFPQGFSCLVVLWILLGFTWISLTGLSPSSITLSRVFSYPHSIPCRSPQPQNINILVWPVSLSLATTQEIDFSFSSCRYLDVSVPCVPLI